MVRVTVGTFHTLFAALLATLGLVLVLQSWIGAHWEIGFYGVASPATVSELVFGLMCLGMAGLEALGAVGLVLERRWGAWITLFSSFALLLRVPWPLDLLMGVAGCGAVWALAPSIDDEDVDDESDDQD